MCRDCLVMKVVCGRVGTRIVCGRVEIGVVSGSVEVAMSCFISLHRKSAKVQGKQLKCLNNEKFKRLKESCQSTIV